MKKHILVLLALTGAQLYGASEGLGAKLKRLATQIQSPTTRSAALQEINGTSGLLATIQTKANEIPKGPRPPETKAYAQTILRNLPSSSSALPHIKPAAVPTTSSPSATPPNSNALIKEVQRGDAQKVKVLLATPGIDVNYRAPADPRSTRLKSGGNTPLHEAFKKLREKGGESYAAIAQALIDNGTINASITTDAQATPLHMLAGFVPESNPDLPKPEKQGEIKDNEEKQRPDLAQIANELLDKKRININARDESGRTPLHWAANQGYADLVQTFLKRGADVNAQDINGRTPLMKAAQKGYVGIMQQLINAGANVNMQDTNKGRTALHWVQRMREGATVKSGNQMTKERALKAIGILLNAGANPTIQDKVTEDNPEAHTPIDWAMEKSPWQTDENKELEMLLRFA